jgi:hypothetical protein
MEPAIMKTLIPSLLAISMLGATAAALAAQPSPQERFVATVLAPAAAHDSVRLTAGAARDQTGDARDLLVLRVLAPRLVHVEPTIVTAGTEPGGRSLATNSYL